MKLRLSFAFLGLAAFAASSSSAFAGPIFGGQVFATGGNVNLTVLPGTASFTSEIWLFAPNLNVIGQNHADVGTTFDLGNFDAGPELMFGIHIISSFPGDGNTGKVYLMGEASRNPDNIVHATVDWISPTVAVIGFEDIFGGGDQDYNDVVFRLEGAIAAAPPPGSSVPEPATLAVWSVAGLGLAGWHWRRRRFQMS